MSCSKIAHWLWNVEPFTTPEPPLTMKLYGAWNRSTRTYTLKVAGEKVPILMPPSLSNVQLKKVLLRIDSLDDAYPKHVAGAMIAASSTLAETPTAIKDAASTTYGAVVRFLGQETSPVEHALDSTAGVATTPPKNAVAPSPRSRL
jgi:hypothetical protein